MVKSLQRVSNSGTTMQGSNKYSSAQNGLRGAVESNHSHSPQTAKPAYVACCWEDFITQFCYNKGMFPLCLFDTRTWTRCYIESTSEHIGNAFYVDSTLHRRCRVLVSNRLVGTRLHHCMWTLTTCTGKRSTITRQRAPQCKAWTPQCKARAPQYNFTVIRTAH